MLMTVRCSSSIGYRIVVPELAVTITCAVQIFHGELPEMNSEAEHYCNFRISNGEPSSEDNMLSIRIRFMLIYIVLMLLVVGYGRFKFLHNKTLPFYKNVMIGLRCHQTKI